MKLIPILFSTPMVNAIMRGDKTMTRRKLKVQPKDDQDWKISRMIESTSKIDQKNEGKLHWVTMENEYSIKEYDDRYFDCPYGQVGDVLWVRESFCQVLLGHAHDLLEGVKDSSLFVYKTSFHEDWMDYAKEKYGYKWKPSIHMPKAACRIFLEITNIRVERLHDITPDDIRKEGKPNGDYALDSSCLQWWEELWQSINGAESWDENPWVWVIEFKRIVKPSNFL